MIDAASTIAGLIIGGGLGTIAGGLFAAGRVREIQQSADFWEEQCIEEAAARRKFGRELAELRSSRNRSNAPLKAANAARHAKAEAAKAAARELTARRHAEMRELVREVI